ncbi:MAG: metallopeptidase TldD-related protein, partial [Planctomycetota bacterium]
MRGRNSQPARFQILFAVVCLALFTGIVTAQEKASEEDVILRALQDELKRSMDRLQLKDMQKPYFIAYSAHAGAMYMVGATFGALTQENESPMRSTSTEVRVGDYVLDNTNFGGGMYFGGFFGGGLCLEDDYDYIRRQLWLSTDSDYKSALETLTGKKAFLENQKIKDRPDDFSKEAPVVLVEPKKKLEVDKAKWKGMVKKISAIFREFPDIHEAQAAFVTLLDNRYYVNSEGFRHRTGQMIVGFVVNASTTCEDGMSVSNALIFGGRDEKAVPAEDVLASQARALAKTLLDQRNAPKAEDYTGPVLFVGDAAAEFFLNALGKHLGTQRESEGGRGFSFGRGIRLNDKIGKRILPKSITVKDDPTKNEHGGKPLLGGYAVDDDGVKAQPVTLVEGGRLLTLLTTRVPTKETKKSNGHCRGGNPGISNLFVESSDKTSLADLKKELIQAAKDEDLPFGILVRKLAGAAGSMAGGGG